ncbi:GNAT family N-acetyltransferase [Chitinophaga vietnamensis]|uniref:GNAT family N-acetyltransferase n=1 Tax=Chitinophaga vietnamensis TaxID=2593957 RepID=UPI0011778BC9|nr:GNAT family N-acetyltransferase [Chitinophaga vietnamensis]
MAEIDVTKEDYRISSDKQLLNVPVIHRFLSEESYWAKDIPLGTVLRQIENSVCFGLFHKDEQIGFARVITDKTTFAYLADVFVLQPWRGKGLSKWLVEQILAHPDLQGLRRWLLATSDAHGLYAQFGFTPLANPERIMQIHNPDVYTKKEE